MHNLLTQKQKLNEIINMANYDESMTGDVASVYDAVVVTMGADVAVVRVAEGVAAAVVDYAVVVVAVAELQGELFEHVFEDISLQRTFRHTSHKRISAAFGAPSRRECSGCNLWKNFWGKDGSGSSGL